MPDMTAFMTILGQYWYYFAAGAGILALLAVYGAAYAHALRPRAGTLEWIRAYDRPGFSMVGRWYPLERADAAPVLCASLLAAAAWGFAAWRSYQAAYGGAAIPAAVTAAAAAYYLALPAATACGAYFLFKGLFGSTSVALLGTLILSADLTAEPTTVLFAVLSALFLLRFLTAGEDRGFGAAAPSLVLAFAALTVGCYFDPSLSLLLAAALVLLTAGCASRFVQLGKGGLVRSLLTAAAAVAVTTVLLYIPAAVVEGMRFPQLLIAPEYYRLIVRRGTELFSGLFRGWFPPALLPAICFDWPLLVCGLGALTAAAAGLFRRRDYRGLFLAVWFLALAAMWIFCGSYALPLGCTACLCYVWADLYRREKPSLAGLGAACILLILLSLYVMSWIIR